MYNNTMEMAYACTSTTTDFRLINTCLKSMLILHPQILLEVVITYL